jgi:hypothetical protein
MIAAIFAMPLETKIRHLILATKAPKHKEEQRIFILGIKPLFFLSGTLFFIP